VRNILDTTCIRLRPQQRNHVWSYDFVEDRTHDGRKYRMLNVLDEFTHECLAIRVARKLKAIDVIDVLSDLFILRGVSAHIRSDNGPEFVARAVQEWIAAVGTKTACIEYLFNDWHFEILFIVAIILQFTHIFPQDL
jgi:putative transposase